MSKMSIAPLIRPFAALRPQPQHAAAVAAPPYDVLSSEEARVQATGKPYSFLHISKAEIDLPPEIDHYAPEVYAQSAKNLKKLIDAAILLREDAPCYYVYRLIMGEHTQTGLIASASVAAYDENRIHKHELTRVDKEDDRVRQVEALNAQTGPVLLVHPDNAEVERLLDAATNDTPIADFTADTGVHHTLWRIKDTACIGKISALINAMPALYIADGHHRSAAASRVAAARRGKVASDSAEYFLSVMFSARQMRILDYNRVVRDLNGASCEDFLAALSARGALSAENAPVKPRKTGEFGVYLKGQWYRFVLDANYIPQADPVARLDVSVLFDAVLAPILGIGDLRRDTRIDFVGGIRGLGELAKRVDSGEMAVAFSLYPTPMSALMAVADAGKIMPPKSTWFEPKLADGLASHVLD